MQPKVLDGSLPLENLDVQDAVEAWVRDKMSKGLANSTRMSYSDAWKRWLFWCERRGIAPVLSGETKEERAEDEEELLDELH